MPSDVLLRFGEPGRRLADEIGCELFPWQEAGIKAGLLNGANLTVCTPTGGGKTAFAAMAAAASPPDARVVYAATTRALAAEKHADFGRWFGAERVIISTGDRTQDDRRLAEGDFKVAVVTVEKLVGILTADRKRPWIPGVAIIDELHLLADRGRGAAMDFLLTALKCMEPRPQLITLSTVVENAREIAEWLGTRLIVEKRRLVELRKGVLDAGLFRYIEQNSGRRDEEPLSAGGGPFEAIEELAVRRKEPTLVLLKTKRDVEEWAADFARQVSLPACEEAIADLKNLPDSRQRDMAREFFGSSIGVHHADLWGPLRAIVEKHARAGRLRVVFASPTLSSGVHLPFKNVFVHPEKWCGTSVRLTGVECDNACGRAGRPGFGPGPGRAILLPTGVESPDDMLESLAQPPGSIRPVGANLAERAFRALALRGAGTVSELAEFLKETFTARLEGGLPSDELLKAALASLDGIVERRGERIGLTQLGVAAARSGIRPTTAALLKRWCDDHESASFVRLEMLLSLAATPDGEEVSVPMTRDESYSSRWGDAFKAAAPAQVIAKPEVACLLGYRAMSGSTAILKKALIADAWARKAGHRELEEQFGAGGGVGERIGHDFARLTHALARIAKTLGWPKERLHVIRETATALRHEEPLVEDGPATTTMANDTPTSATGPLFVLPGTESPTGAVGDVRLRDRVLEFKETPYDVFVHLALARRYTDDGWVRVECLGGKPLARSRVEAVRKVLVKGLGKGAAGLVRNERGVGYRLEVPRDQVQVDCKALRKAWPTLFNRACQALKIKPDV